MLLACLIISVCVACVCVKNRKKKAWNYPTRTQPSPAVVTATTEEVPQAFPYPATTTNDDPYTLARQAPPPHPSYQPEKPLPDSTLQQAPPPSYSKAVTYPPPSYSSAPPYPQKGAPYPENPRTPQDRAPQAIGDPLEPRNLGESPAYYGAPYPTVQETGAPYLGPGDVDTAPPPSSEHCI